MGENKEPKHPFFDTGMLQKKLEELAGEDTKKAKRYNHYPVETIDMMEMVFGREATYHFCLLSAFKYRMRMGLKHDNFQTAALDFKKEKEYLEMAEKYKKPEPIRNAQEANKAVNSMTGKPYKEPEKPSYISQELWDQKDRLQKHLIASIENGDDLIKNSQGKLLVTSTGSGIPNNQKWEDAFEMFYGLEYAQMFDKMFDKMCPTASRYPMGYTGSNKKTKELIEAELQYWNEYLKQEKMNNLKFNRYVKTAETEIAELPNGNYVCRQPDNPSDTWGITKEYFLANYKPVMDIRREGSGETVSEYNPVKENKELRRDIDAILQRLKDAPRSSRPRNLSITKLQEAVMWLGMDLKELNEPNPYPESKNPKSDKIEPTADGLKL